MQNRPQASYSDFENHVVDRTLDINYEQFFEDFPEAIFILQGSSIAGCNENAAALFGCHSKIDLVGHDFPVLSLDKTKKSLRTHEQNTLMIESALKEGRCDFDTTYFRKNGESFLARTSLIKLDCASDDICAAVVRDVTRYSKNEEEIKSLAYKDSLTGLYNRRYFLKYLNELLSSADNKPIAVLFFDLDGFKKINDNLGHANGDKLLQVVAKNIKRIIGLESIVARIGGDEFITAIENYYDEDEIIELANSIVEFFRQPFIFDTHIFHMSVSIGIALHPSNGDDVEALIKNADIAMYKAKERPGSYIEFFSPNLNEKINSAFVLENNLWFALDKEEFHLEYQPIVDIDSGKVVAAESLLRWKSSKLGLVPPYSFIPIAEENNLIVPIGKWVLREACSQNKKWQDMGLSPITVAVNVSLKQFEQDDFVKTVSKTLMETGLEPKYLELEITESIPVENISHTIDVLSRLSDLGVKLSIDDFGTGYSSLGQLKKLSIDTLKIDKSFVSDININTDNTEIVSTIIAMANILNLQVVAEGIETDNQLGFLRDNSCSMGQGYLFSRPLGEEAFVEFLIENNSLSNG